MDPLLAYAADRSCAKIVHFTRGKSGFNRTGPEMDHDLARVRSAEMAAAAEVLGAEHEFLGYYNGFPYPADTTGNSVEEATRRWKAVGAGNETPAQAVTRWNEQGPDTQAAIIGVLDNWKPDIVITFDPEFGYIDHREHCAVGIIVTAALREEAHWCSEWRPEALYYVVRCEHHTDREREMITSAALAPDEPERYLDTGKYASPMTEYRLGTGGCL